MTIQRRMLPKVQTALRKPKKAKKPGFTDAVKKTVDIRSKGVCERDSCGPIEQYHHRAPRGLGGTSVPWVNKAANAFGVSMACHSYIEAHRMQAYVNGWLVARNGPKESAEVPIMYRGSWVLLRDEGSPQPLDGDGWDEWEALA